MKSTKSLFGTIAITCGLAVCGYSQSFVTNGLVAYYPFDGNAKDAVGTNNGTVIGSDWKFLPDRFGNPQSSLFLNTTSPPSVTLNGAYVSARKSSALDFSKDFTLSVWVNVIESIPDAEQVLISNGSDGLHYAVFAVEPKAGVYPIRVGCSWGGTNAADAVVPPFTNSWHQFVAVRSGNNTTLYENGSALTNAIMSAPLNSSNIWIGRFQPFPSGNQNTFQLFGGIDDLRMYNRALSASEVQQLYAFESGPRVDLIKIVQPSLSNLTLGTNYQLQVSTDLRSWTNSGSAFTATNSSVIYPQYFNVENWNQLFFRLGP